MKGRWRVVLTLEATHVMGAAILGLALATVAAWTYYRVRHFASSGVGTLHWWETMCCIASSISIVVLYLSFADRSVLFRSWYRCAVQDLARTFWVQSAAGCMAIAIVVTPLHGVLVRALVIHRHRHLYMAGACALLSLILGTWRLSYVVATPRVLSPFQALYGITGNASLARELSGAMSASAFFVLGTALGLFYARAYLARLREGCWLSGRCPFCHYDLSGIPPGTGCPECGAGR